MFADDVTVIGVAGRSDLDAFESFITEQEVDGFDHIVDIDGDIWKEFGITTQPAFTFINDDGTRDRQLGALGLESLTARVNDLIAR